MQKHITHAHKIQLIGKEKNQLIERHRNDKDDKTSRKDIKNLYNYIPYFKKLEEKLNMSRFERF